MANTIVKTLVGYGMSLATGAAVAAANGVRINTSKKSKSVMDNCIEKRVIEPTHCNNYIVDQKKNRIVLMDSEIQVPAIKLRKLESYNDVLGFFNNNYTESPIIDLAEGRIKIDSYYEEKKVVLDSTSLLTSS